MTDLELATMIATSVHNPSHTISGQWNVFDMSRAKLYSEVVGEASQVGLVERNLKVLSGGEIEEIVFNTQAVRERDVLVSKRRAQYVKTAENCWEDYSEWYFRASYASIKGTTVCLGELNGTFASKLAK